MLTFQHLIWPAFSLCFQHFQSQVLETVSAAFHGVSAAATAATLVLIEMMETMKRITYRSNIDLEGRFRWGAPLFRRKNVLRIERPRQGHQRTQDCCHCIVEAAMVGSLVKFMVGEHNGGLMFGLEAIYMEIRSTDSGIQWSRWSPKSCRDHRILWN